MNLIVVYNVLISFVTYISNITYIYIKFTDII